MSVIHTYVVVITCLNMWSLQGNTKKLSLSVERYNFFDAELLQVLFDNKETNLLISPVSIKLVLGMLMEGAEGDTASEIRTALRLPEDNSGEGKEFEAWLSSLQEKESSSSLKIANQIFLSDQIPVNQNYTTALNKHYTAGVTFVKFKNGEEASKIINNWVSNQTNHLISNIVQGNQITPDMKMILASAIYFKEAWLTPFSPERSKVRCFYMKDNHCKNSVMMMETGYFDYGYISRLDAEAIQLPYKDGKYSMLILLPTRRNGLEQLCRDLVHVSLKSVQSEMKPQEVVVQIPQFEIGYNTDMIETLEKLHISKLFSPHANLSKINSTSFAVSHILHSAKITVNEEGSEAAAATGALFVPLMGGTTTTFIANHPFLFFIMHSTKNSILFAGKVYSPEPIEEISKDTARARNCRKNLAGPRCKVPSSDESLGYQPQFQGSKFRAVKAAFPHSRTAPSRKKETVLNSSAEQIGNSVVAKPLRKNTLSYPVNYIPVYGQAISIAHADKNKKRRKSPTEHTRHPKKEVADDMRRHVLLFS